MHHADLFMLQLPKIHIVVSSVDPRFGIASLGKVNMTYENDRDLMIQFYKFVAM